MIAEQQRGRARRTTARAPSGSIRPCCGITRCRDEEGAEHQRRDADRDVDPEHRLPREVLEQEPTGDRADGDGRGRRSRPRPRWPEPRSRGSRKTLVRIDSVAGMISAPPMPMNARVAIRPVGRRRHRRGGGADAEQHDAELQRTLASVAVGQAAGGEQQAGEHEHVGVDDPLDLAVRGAEVDDQRRDRDVEDRVVHHDDQQAHAEHAEDQPAAFVDGRVEFVVVRVRRTVRLLRLSLVIVVRLQFRYDTDAVFVIGSSDIGLLKSEPSRADDKAMESSSSRTRRHRHGRPPTTAVLLVEDDDRISEPLIRVLRSRGLRGRSRRRRTRRARLRRRPLPRPGAARSHAARHRWPRRLPQAARPTIPAFRSSC